MDHELAPAFERWAATMPGGRTLELAERPAGGAVIRLFWREGSRDVWLQIRDENTGRTTTVAVSPEHALDAFRHPYSYAAGSGGRSLTGGIAV